MRVVLAVLATIGLVVGIITSSPDAASISLGGGMDYTCKVKPAGGRCVCNPTAPSDSGDTCDGIRPECLRRGADTIECTYPVNGEPFCWCEWGNPTGFTTTSQMTLVTMPSAQSLSW